MKVHLHLALAWLCTIAFTQAQSSSKICLDDQTTHIKSLQGCESDWIIGFDRSLLRTDASGKGEKWRIRLPSTLDIHHELGQYGDRFLLAAYSNQVQNGMPSKTEMLYFVDRNSGQLTDSLKLDFTTLALDRSDKESGSIPAIASQGGQIKAVLVDRSTGKIRQTIYTEKVVGGYSVLPNLLRFTPNQKQLIVGTAGGNAGLIVFDARSYAQIAAFAGKGDIHSIAFDSEGQFCFFILDQQLKVLNLATFKIETNIPLVEKGQRLDLHPDKEQLVITGFGNTSKVEIVHWRSGKSRVIQENSNGCQPAFNAQGDMLYPSANGLQCIVDSEKMPYLSKLVFKVPFQSTNSETWTTGMRVFIRYSGDGKYYSGTIVETTTNTLNVLFDDGVKASVNRSEVKALPALRSGEKVQYRAADKKFYWAVVGAIQGEQAQLFTLDGNALGSVSKRDIMQVE